MRDLMEFLAPSFDLGEPLTAMDIWEVNLLLEDLCLVFLSIIFYRKSFLKRGTDMVQRTKLSLAMGGQWKMVQVLEPLATH